MTAVLAKYPEEVITAATHPATGLPSRRSFLPTIKELVDFCNDLAESIWQNELRLKRIKEAMEIREREARGERPSLEFLQEKYGPNWGIGSARAAAIGADFKAPTADALRTHYAEFGLSFKPKQGAV